MSLSLLAAEVTPVLQTAGTLESIVRLKEPPRTELAGLRSRPDLD